MYALSLLRLPSRALTRQAAVDYAQLETLDLSQIGGDNYENVPENVVQTIGDAFARDGFIYATNHGLSAEDILRYTDPSLPDGRRC